MFGVGVWFSPPFVLCHSFVIAFRGHYILAFLFLFIYYHSDASCSWNITLSQDIPLRYLSSSAAHMGYIISHYYRTGWNSIIAYRDVDFVWIHSCQSYPNLKLISYDTTLLREKKWIAWPDPNQGGGYGTLSRKPALATSVHRPISRPK